MKAAKIVGNIIEWSVFIGLVGLVIIIASPFLPTKKFVSAYAIVTGSMEPAIPKGSLVLTRPITASTLRNGDVVSYTSPQNPKDTIVHRIVNVDTKNNQAVFTTKGDNNNAADTWAITDAQIKGKLIYSIPYLGNLIAAAKSVYGFAILIILPAVILSVLLFIRIKQGLDETSNVKRDSGDEYYRKSMLRPLVVLLLSIGCMVSARQATAYFSSRTAYMGFTINIGRKVPEPKITASYNKPHHQLTIKVLHVKEYPRLEYQVKYMRDDGVSEEIDGNLVKNESGEIAVDDMIFGSCSNDICAYHTITSPIHVKVDLYNHSHHLVIEDDLDKINFIKPIF